MKVSALLLTMALFLSLRATAVAAQVATSERCPSCRNSVSVVGGVTQYDLSGTGSAFIAGAHLDRRVRPWLIGDASLRVLRPVEQFRERSWYAIPELQLQLQTPRGVVRPYVGAGGGWFVGPQWRGTASGALGLRYVGRETPLGARAELRVRGIGRTFSGAAAEWSLGAAYHF